MQNVKELIVPGAILIAAYWLSGAMRYDAIMIGPIEVVIVDNWQGTLKSCRQQSSDRDWLCFQKSNLD